MHATRLLELIEQAPEHARDIDGRDIDRLDSTGAMLLSRYAVRVGLGLATVDVKPEHQPLIDTVQRDLRDAACARRKRDLGFQRHARAPRATRWRTTTAKSSP